MLRRKMLLRFLVSAIVITIAGIGFSKKPPVKGPVQEMDYDETTDVVLGLPNGLAPVSSFGGALAKGVALPADLTTYPPNPCLGNAQVWNGIVAEMKKASSHGGDHGCDDHGHHGGWGWGDHGCGCSSSDALRQALVITLQAMATNQCALQIVRDDSTSPPTIVSITPIASF